MNYKKLFFSIMPVIFLGILTGIMQWHVFFESPPHRYDLDFSGAKWISTGRPMPNGYFVKELYISEDVADAWISVAATDYIELYVNGVMISSDRFVSLNVSGIHDISGSLKKGRNTIAAYVGRSSYPGGPMMLLKGSYLDFSGRRHIFTSDASWLISYLEEVSPAGPKIKWNSASFDHSAWIHAKVEGGESSFPVHSSEIPPFLIGSPITAAWIWYPGHEVSSAYFIKTLNLDSHPGDAFIGISGSAAYDLTVNSITVKKNMVLKDFMIFEITSLLHAGENIIGIGVESSNVSPGLLVQGYIDDGGLIKRFTSDLSWKTVSGMQNSQHLPDPDSSEWKEAVLLGTYPAEPWGILKKSYRHIDLPLIFQATHFFRQISFIIVVAGLFFCLCLLYSYFHHRFSGWHFLDSLLLDGLFHLPALLFMCYVFLLGFDVRYDSSYSYKYGHFIVSIIMICLFRLAGFIEAAAAGKKRL